MAAKKEIAKERFDVRAIYENAGMSERDYVAVPKVEKQAGKNSDYVRVTFSKRLTDQLESCLLTETAREVEIAQGSLSDYRSGKAEPRISALARIAGHFHISSDYLLGLTDTKSISPSKKAACEYTGLSDKAITMLHAGTADQERPLYSAIVSHLFESGTLDNLVKLLEKSLILQEQYAVLFDADDEQRQNSLETQEYQFNKQISGLYTNVTNDLSEKLSAEITHIAEQRFLDLVDGAMDTKEKMEKIIDEALSDPVILNKYNRRHQTF